MANIISLKGLSSNKWLSMSNGATDVFIDILEQVYCANKFENLQVTWIINNHRDRIAIGCSGFDMGDIPWVKDSFIEDRNQLYKVVKLMKDQSYWLKLCY